MLMKRKEIFTMTFENALKRIKTAFANVDASKLADMLFEESNQAVLPCFWGSCPHIWVQEPSAAWVWRW